MEVRGRKKVEEKPNVFVVVRSGRWPVVERTYVNNTKPRSVQAVSGEHGFATDCRTELERLAICEHLCGSLDCLLISTVFSLFSTCNLLIHLFLVSPGAMYRRQFERG